MPADAVQWEGGPAAAVHRISTATENMRMTRAKEGSVTPLGGSTAAVWSAVLDLQRALGWQLVCGSVRVSGGGGVEGAVNKRQ